MNHSARCPERKERRDVNNPHDLELFPRPSLRNRVSRTFMRIHIRPIIVKGPTTTVSASECPSLNLDVPSNRSDHCREQCAAQNTGDEKHRYMKCPHLRRGLTASVSGRSQPPPDWENKKIPTAGSGPLHAGVKRQIVIIHMRECPCRNTKRLHKCLKCRSSG